MGSAAFAEDTFSISSPSLLMSQKEQSVVLHLSRADGSPLRLSDLVTAHQSKIHLLVVDDSMTDYQHIHPAEGTAPGDYIFSFTPKTAHDYTVWADILPVSAPHEYLKAALKGKDPCKTACISKALSLKGASQGLTGALSFDRRFLKAKEAAMGRLIIKDESGQPVKDLEPVMGAFAHIVGFYAGKTGVVHLHPMGDEPVSDQARGGPSLVFHLEPDRPGIIKLFAQVRRGGKDIFIPFTLRITS